MNESEIKSETQPELAELQEQFENLRGLMVSLLLLAVVISGTLSIYLLRQVKYARADLAGFRPQAAQVIADYAKLTAPRMNDMLKKISEYGRTHPDFVPILTKYGLKPATAPAAPAATTTPSPAPAPK